jgi:hypothetical protein
LIVGSLTLLASVVARERSAGVVAVEGSQGFRWDTAVGCPPFFITMVSANVYVETAGGAAGGVFELLA